MPASCNNHFRTVIHCCILQLAVCGLHWTLPSLSYADDNALGAREETALNAAADRVAPSVVQIRTIGGLDVVDGTLLADGPTTGLVISSDGYILSSAVNFAQQPASILITLSSGRQVPAKLVATDHSRMLVLLKAEGATDLPVPELAPATEAKPGQWAVAIGRTFRADRTNITVGIISALNRMYGKAIQTDADVSAANYGGPLVDIRGRVIGLLVPMSPQATSELAGTEWYDSGIGFAVPLAPLSDRIERMKKGEDQRAGLLGIGMKIANAHSAPAQLSVVRPDSPAGQAGFKKGDRIIEVDGKLVGTQSDLRFALGTAYGGDSIRVVAKRGDERVEGTVKLVGELPPFRQAFLGILPIRDASDEPESKESGVTVRAVYPGSPAAEAGVQPGDQITEINDAAIKSIDDAIQALNNLTPESKVSARVLRKGSTLDLALTATRLPTSIPTDLPTASAAPAGPDTAKSAGETAELKLAEFAHTCEVYVPGAHAENLQLAALLWIENAGDAKAEAVIRDWQAECDRRGIILIVPRPAKADHWERTDLEYLHRLLEQAIAQYKIDPRRVIVGGQGAAGSIAWPLGLASRDIVRGIVAVASPLPRQSKVPQNDPAQRLAVFAGIPAKNELTARIAVGLKSISDAGFNVTTIATQSTTGELKESERADLANWIDTLDRF
jgi:serine protease Do